MMPMVGQNPPADSNTLGMCSSCSAWLSSSSSIILRISLGSVPSTASINDFLKKGSATLLSSESRATIPSFLALCAYFTISPINCCGSREGSTNTPPNRLTAAKTTFNGNCSSTAPNVPPKTIIAAVGCTICAILPPSKNNPNKIPPSARNSPPKLLLSTLRTSLVIRPQCRFSSQLERPCAWILRVRGIPFGIHNVRPIPVKHQPSIADDAAQHLIR